jgi:hypothetical protein
MKKYFIGLLLLGIWSFFSNNIHAQANNCQTVQFPEGSVCVWIERVNNGQYRVRHLLSTNQSTIALRCDIEYGQINIFRQWVGACDGTFYYASSNTESVSIDVWLGKNTGKRVTWKYNFNNNNKWGSHSNDWVSQNIWSISINSNHSNLNTNQWASISIQAHDINNNIIKNYNSNISFSIDYKAALNNNWQNAAFSSYTIDRTVYNLPLKNNGEMIFNNLIKFNNNGYYRLTIKDMTNNISNSIVFNVHWTYLWNTQSTGAFIYPQSLKITSDRWDGFCATIVYTNTTSQTQHPWWFSFGLNNATITSFSNGRYTIQNNKITVSPLSWNQILPPQASVSVGFCANGKGRPSIGLLWQTSSTQMWNIHTAIPTTHILYPTTITSTTNIFILNKPVSQCIFVTNFNLKDVIQLTYKNNNTTIWSNKWNYILNANWHLWIMPCEAGLYNITKATTYITESTNTNTITNTNNYSSNIWFAPYVDMLLWPTPHLPTIASDSGIKKFVASFILDAGWCVASWWWIASYNLASQFSHSLLTQFNELRSQSGEIIISLGGANWTELALGCSTIFDTYIQYKSIVQKYNLTIIDFDIEWYALGHSASNIRRAKALKLLQQDYPNLKIWLTLPTLPNGLTNDGIRTINEFIAAWVRIDGINIMTMNYGSYAAPDPSKMWQYAVDASNALFDHLKSIYPWFNTGKIWSMIGITAMIWLNDVSPEVFSLADAQLIKNFASQKWIGILSMRSINRDRSCNNNAAIVSYNCSWILQTPYQFSNILRL